MKETWKAVPAWEGVYEVSDQGRVRSVTRTIYAKNPVGVVAPRTYAGRVLLKAAGKRGYEMVSFTAPGRKRTYSYVHALVAAAFIGPKPSGKEVCHNNGRRSDNRRINIRYDTRSANALDRHAHGTMNQPCGERCAAAKLTKHAVRYIREVGGGVSQRALGRMFGVSHSTIAAAASGKSWKHI